jgi:ATP-dependent RNA helicase DDX55/SPB4
LLLSLSVCEDYTVRAVCVNVLFLSLSTCACVEYFGRALEALIKSVTIHCIHGKMKHKRNKIFSEFRSLKRYFIPCC